MQRGTRGPTRLVTRRAGRRWRIAGAAGAVVLVLAVGAQVADAHTGTVGEWRFDEAGGQTALDGGPFGLDGRLGTSAGVDGADPQRIPGVASGALRFGGGSYVQLPDAAELAQPTLSVEAVVRAPTSPGAYRYIVSRGGQGCFAGSYGLYTAKGGGVAFYAFDGSGYVVSAAARAATRRTDRPGSTGRARARRRRSAATSAAATSPSRATWTWSACGRAHCPRAPWRRTRPRSCA